jgi:hypothetical protein
MSAASPLPTRTEPTTPAGPAGPRRLWPFVVLALLHLALPFFIRWIPPPFAEYQLLCSIGAIYAQLTIVPTLLVFGGLSWRGGVVVIAVFSLSCFLWSWNAPSPFTTADVLDLLSPMGILLIFLVPRLFGLRGTFAPFPPPAASRWQLSLFHILSVITLIALVLGGANWLRLITREIEFQFPTTFYVLMIVVAGMIASSLNYLTLWAFGTPGRRGAKVLVLIALWTTTSGLMIYINEMDDYWQYQAATEGAWAVVQIGTVALYRLTGWRLERSRRPVPADKSRLVGQ